MTTTDLVQRISERFAIDADASADVVREIVSALSGAMLHGRHIEIRGFGTFDLVIASNHNWGNSNMFEEAGRSENFDLNFKAGKILRSKLKPAIRTG